MLWSGLVIPITTGIDPRHCLESIIGSRITGGAEGEDSRVALILSFLKSGVAPCGTIY